MRRESYQMMAIRMVAEGRARTFSQACAILGRRGGQVSAKAKQARAREVRLQEAKGLR